MRRRASVAAIILACYLSALLAVNLTSNPSFANSYAGFVAGHIFPRVGASSRQIDTASIQYEWDVIQQNYVYRDVGGDKGTQGAEAGIMTALETSFKDRFALFLPAASSKALTESLTNQRSGSIGLSVEARCAGGLVCPQGQAATEVVIGDVLLGQPADTAGIKRGDVLTAVDSTEMSTLQPFDGAALTKLTGLVRGTAGTTVKLIVQRGAQKLTVAVTRGNLAIPSLYVKKLGTILYIQVTGFESDTGTLAKQLIGQNIAGTTGIVLDVRGNGGGYVDAAQQLVSQFVEPNDTVKNVVVRRGRMDQSGDPNSAQVVHEDPVLGGGLALKPPLVVLVNGDSASASEITTAALRDYHRAVVVGDKTFGKGSVQVDFALPDGNDLHLTVEKWYGPNGENIDGVGITPDAAVALPNPDARFRADAQSPDPAQDAQLQAALRVLGG